MENWQEKKKWFAKLQLKRHHHEEKKVGDVQHAFVYFSYSSVSLWLSRIPLR